MGIRNSGIRNMKIAKQPATGRSWGVSGLVALMIALPLGGCSDGLELNGKIFDLLGVSSAAQAAKSSEPKLAARPGLVLPPDASRLPEPGKGGADDSSVALAAVVDPDVKRATDAKERERLHQLYCSGQMNWKERIADKSAQPTSPYGPCGALGDALKQN